MDQYRRRYFQSIHDALTSIGQPMRAWQPFRLTTALICERISLTTLLTAFDPRRVRDMACLWVDFNCQHHLSSKTGKAQPESTQPTRAQVDHRGAIQGQRLVMLAGLGHGIGGPTLHRLHFFTPCRRLGKCAELFAYFGQVSINGVFDSFAAALVDGGACVRLQTIMRQVAATASPDGLGNPLAVAQTMGLNGQVDAFVHCWAGESEHWIVYDVTGVEVRRRRNRSSDTGFFETETARCSSARLTWLNSFHDETPNESYGTFGRRFHGEYR